MGSKSNVILLGDSITQGLGSKKVNFTEALQGNLGNGYEIHNLAYTGTTIDYPLDLMKTESVLSGGGTCVILYGNVDAQIRPSRTGKVFPHIPERYRHNGMLMPRPFYSHSLIKSVPQHLDNLQRKVLSALIKAVDGTEQWVHIEDFDRMYRELVQGNLARGTRCICCSTVFIDERLFKGTPAQYELFNKRIRAISEEFSCAFLDFYSLLAADVEEGGWESVYNSDHFHPNAAGYKVMADAIARAVLQITGDESK